VLKMPEGKNMNGSGNCSGTRRLSFCNIVVISEL
jgi:hypothetical protein